MATFELLRAKVESGGADRLWWTWRYLEKVLDLSSEGRNPSQEESEFAFQCFLALMDADPDWAVGCTFALGPMQAALCDLLATRITAAVVRVAPTNAFLRARLMIMAVSDHRQRSVEEQLERWAPAWRELTRVPESERDEAWTAAAITATEHADYGAYRPLMTAYLSKLEDPFYRARALSEAALVAGKFEDWPTFEQWVADYRMLPEPHLDPHQHCAIMNYEGIRALNAGRDSAAENVMKRIVALAPAVEFLSNEETSRLPRRMRAEGKCTSLCDEFFAVVDKTDWRLSL